MLSPAQYSLNTLSKLVHYWLNNRSTPGRYVSLSCPLPLSARKRLRQPSYENTPPPSPYNHTPSPTPVSAQPVTRTWPSKHKKTRAIQEIPTISTYQPFQPILDHFSQFSNHFSQFSTISANSQLYRPLFSIFPANCLKIIAANCPKIIAANS